ncbi:MAG: hypothetical protein ACRC6M_00315 [Microcystaceae cyanobacterium]
MLSSFHYALRSKLDGQYLVARLKAADGETAIAYLILFKEDYDVLSYVQTHAPELREKFGTESVSNSQLKGLIQRWGFKGLGLVQDPLEPRIEFVSISDQLLL